MTQKTTLFPADPRKISEVVMTESGITVEEFIAVVRYGAKLTFSTSYEERVVRVRGIIERFLRENRRIYGVTTGFGENVRYIIPPKDAEQLQRNIIHSHSCSVGRPLEIEQVRAIMMMQIINIGGGYSGVTLELIHLIRDMLNSGVTPWAPGEGSVGYLGVEGLLPADAEILFLTSAFLLYRGFARRIRIS